MTIRFQSFDSKSEPASAAGRVADLRAWLADRNLHGVLVPRSDEHQGEYVAAYAERLSWLTGFTGSAGIALILAGKAVIFVDGRYTLQVRQQTDGAVFTYGDLVAEPPAKWMEANLYKGARIAIDPWLHTISDAATLKSAIEKSGGELVCLSENPVDSIRPDRPGHPLEPVSIHPVERAGKLAKDKLAEMAEAVNKAGADATVLTDPSSIAWTFNIRGQDVPHTPLALGFAIIRANGAHTLFMDKRKMPVKVEAYLTQLAQLHPPSELASSVVKLAESGARIALDTVLAAEKLRLLTVDNGGTYVAMPDPARLPRACKNATELEGARAAHRRDGEGVCRFLAWLDTQTPGSVTEISAVEALEAARIRAGDDAQSPLKDISFDSISGAGPNGAIMHYRVTRQTSRTLSAGELYLIDSGGQYEDGTTDITRTVPIGTPGEEMRRHYTIVLKGLIAISTIRFPPQTRGCDIDVLARAAHWKAGVDFAHGTGHGVGSYLAVHEGPQRIAKTGTQPLMEGMILSNEPGYYREGAYGIRLENLIAVTPAADIDGGDIAMHGFETLTLVPFDRRLIDKSMLTREELTWLNAYHARVLSEIGPILDGADRTWLEAACAPFERHGR